MKKMKMILMTAILGVASLSLVTSCNTDQCKDVVCDNGGVCSDIDGSCDCPAGYYGLSCENDANQAFVGTWSTTERETGTTGAWSTPYAVIVTADGNDSKLFYLKDYGNYLCTTGSYQVTASSTDGTNYSIANTACSTNFNGSGSLNEVGGDKITGSYTATYGTPTTTDNIDVEMTK